MSPEEETVINRNIMKLQEHLYKALKQRDQYKAERDTLIDDIAVLKANISRLELENVKQLKLLKDFSKFINYKLYVSPANDIYKHFRRELDKLGVK
ncbi:hypothetical protein BU116_01140 [Staphylococcus xylosus]|uniref:hypothetical protein n=1 Tax=Staphylococcus TaxID=1279 RepID=UPI000E6A13C3|nr:hypothetical protein [Staphylococcus xylosus]RIM80085.1 hypothetical protein BU116_01140 [Staphylococcus xylosus]